MNLYSIDINVIATAYIKADNPDEALELAEKLVDTSLELSSRYQSAGDDICIDGRDFSALLTNDETVALSPAMTIDGLGEQHVHFVEELE